MSDDNISPVEKPEETSGSEVKPEDLIPYSTHQKLLNEKRNQKSELDAKQLKLDEYEAMIKKFKEDKLTSEGNKDQLLENYKTEIAEIKGQLTTKEKNFAWKAITSSIKEEALRNGCTNPDKLVRLLDDSDLKALEVGEDYTIESQSLKQLIEKSKLENDFLFKRSVSIADSTPNNKSPQAKPQSEREIFEKYIENLNK